MKSPALRFSLRGLLLAAALVPAAVYWFALPTLTASRFAAAINRGDWPAAEALCADAARPFPGKWKEHSVFQPRALVKSLTWEDMWRGERQVGIGIAYGDSHGLSSCAQECTATRRGIELGMAVP